MILDQIQNLEPGRDLKPEYKIFLKQDRAQDLVQLIKIKSPVAIGVIVSKNFVNFLVRDFLAFDFRINVDLESTNLLKIKVATGVIIINHKTGFD